MLDYGPDRFTDFLIDFIRRHRSQRFLAYYPMCLTHKPWAPTPDREHPGPQDGGRSALNLEYLDHVVGRIVDTVDELGIAENTLILFTADNGTQGRGKGKVTELGRSRAAHRPVPRDGAEGTVRSTLVSLADVYPTLVEGAGLGVPHGHEIDGVSLLPTLCGEDVEHREWIFSYYKEERMVRTATWMLDGAGKLYDCAWNRKTRDYRRIKPKDEDDVSRAGPRAPREHPGLHPRS